MNLNLLISKYVDGDLTIEEDQLLRCLLSEDSAAKEAFDAATALHLTMLEDEDSISIPNDFLLETEAFITMKFATDEAIAKALLRENNIKNFKNNLRKLSSVVVALLFIFTVPFSDLFLQRKSNFAENTQQIVDSQNEASLQSFHFSNSKSNRNGQITRFSLRKQDVSASMNNRLLADKNVNIESNAVETISIETPFLTKDAPKPLPSVVLASRNAQYSTLDYNSGTFAQQFNSSGISQSNSTIYQTSTHADQPLNSEQTEIQAKNTEIQVNTFLSNKVANNRDNAISTTAISQSISYSLNEKSKVGVEIGYNGYSYRGGGIVLVPRGTSSVLSKSTILSMDGPESGIPGKDLNPIAEKASQSKAEGFEEKNVEYSIDKTMYWGAAFYEYMIFNKGNISVNGRIGAGGSNDGAMAFTRAFARYDVVKGVSLTVGAEANAFMVNMQTLPNDKESINSGISLVYGMQIKF
ncbi:MAG: hypothetical protein JST20_02270 [Bacteroidetes bacterium]|nr:hypothetical protein [Bacteroidota bacterium]